MVGFTEPLRCVILEASRTGRKAIAMLPAHLETVKADLFAQFREVVEADWGVLARMSDDAFYSEIVAALMALLRYHRADAIDDDERVLIAHAIADEVRARFFTTF